MRNVMVMLGRSVVVMMLAALPARGVAQEATPAVDVTSFSPVVTNPFFPLGSVRYKEYAGEEKDPDTGDTIETRAEETVLPETKKVAGIDVAVVEVKEYEDGELVELTHDYYAQDRDGTVYYLGEAVDEYEDGQVVGHSGSWQAGEGQNQPGLFMPLHPQAGQTFEQEQAPGVAEDHSTVLAVDQSITTSAGQFGGCMRTEDVNPLDGETENKVYCPGVGVVREESETGFLNLVRFEGGPAATPTAAS
jgi:hypothetical protein